MIKKNVKIYAPLTDGVDYEGSLGEFSKTITEFVALSDEIFVQSRNEKISKLSIEILSNEDEDIIKLFTKDDWARKQKNILKFSSSIIVKTNEELEKVQAIYLQFDYFVEKTVQNLIVYSNIARPGAFDTREGITLIEEKIAEKIKIKSEKFNMIVNTLFISVWTAQKYKWPPIKELPIKKTLDWVNQHSLGIETISSNKIQRALNAFSYLFHNDLGNDSRADEDLFYSLIGIEALYVIGNNNIQGQVNEKSQLLLGQRKEFKKVFNAMYDFRSRFIHGELNFVGKFSYDDGNGAEEQRMKTYDHSSFASALLLSTIQKHIELNRNEFEFELKLKE